MTWRRFRGIRHQPDQWPSPHQRARFRAAERLDWPLEASEAAWLADHLAACGECSGVAAEYESQRLELRELRAAEPAPPRDLWARTAAAIESDAAGRERSSRTGAPGFARPMGLPLGAISGVLVMAVVIGASLLSQATPVPAPSTPLTAASPGPPSSRPGATPFLIPSADDVAWLTVNQAGEADVLSAPIDEVCPDGKTSCAPIDGSRTRSITVAAAPVAVVRSPREGELIIVDRPAGETGATVYAVPAPTPTLRPSPGSGAPTTTPASPVPTPTQEATASIEPTPTANGQATASTSPSSSAPAPPSEGPTVSPSVDGAVAIATDVVLVGDSASYSPDGRWFAFSARPADGSAGPDVFVWRAGQDVAVALTTDHQTVFASWLGDAILASRAIGADGSEPGTPDESPGSGEPTRSKSPVEPSATTEPGTTHGDGNGSGEPGDDSTDDEAGLNSQILVIDPDTGAETILGDGAWRPTVRSGGDSAVYWDGLLERAAHGVAIRPSEGRLVLGRWPLEANGRDPQVIEPDAIADWDARWDASGTRLAVWVADDVDSDLGSLSLYVVDEESGRLDRAGRPLVDVQARRGFSLAEGRLAWVSPAGQDGEGTRVQVIAWTADGFGKVETLPAADTIVVVR